MSNKARRRPSWKKCSRPFYIELIDENTGEYMETITVKRGSNLMRMMLRKVGPIETENRLRQAFFDLAERYKEPA